MEKFQQANELLHALVPGFHSEIPALISEACIRRVHTDLYLKKLQAGVMSLDEEKRLGLPVREGLYERSRWEVSGTLAAAKAAISDGMACNLAGGTHHAYPDHGSGYCVLNDVAITIQEVRQERPDWKFMVIDTDAHQGNGTHFIFPNDPLVHTYSIHVGKNFPSQKEPGTMDVPLARWVEADDYLEALSKTLPSALDRFAPDFVFWIAGADPHANDRFGQMKLNTEALDQRNRWVLEWIDDAGPPLAVLFGGGYHRAFGHTSRLHVRAVLQTACIFADRQGLSEEVEMCLKALEDGRLRVEELFPSVPPQS